jgi:phasin family protein
MATNKVPTFDMSKAYGDLSKMFEQFKLPGIDTKEIVEARRKDIDALLHANRAIFEGMQEMANKQGEWMHTAMTDIQAAMTGASGGVTAGDMVEQGETARKACEKVLADMKDLAEIARQSQVNAMAAITKRSSEQLEEVKKMMKIKS